MTLSEPLKRQRKNSSNQQKVLKNIYITNIHNVYQ